MSRNSKPMRFPAREQFPKISDLNNLLSTSIHFTLPAKCTRHTVTPALLDQALKHLQTVSKELQNANRAMLTTAIALLRALTIMLVDDYLPHVSDVTVHTIVSCVKPLMFFGSLVCPTPRGSKSRQLDEDVRFLAIVVVDALARFYSNVLFSEWDSLLPSGPTGFERFRKVDDGTLFTVVLHDTHVHAQYAACNCMSSMLNHAKGILSKIVTIGASDASRARAGRKQQQPTSYTSNLVKYSTILIQAHHGVMNALQTHVGQSSLHGALYRLLQQLIISTPYRAVAEAAHELVGIFRSDEFVASIHAEETPQQLEAILCLRNSFLGNTMIPGLTEYLSEGGEESPSSGPATVNHIIQIALRVDSRFEEALKFLYSMPRLHMDAFRPYFPQVMNVFEAGMKASQEGYRYAVLLGISRLCAAHTSDPNARPDDSDTSMEATSLFSTQEWNDLFTRVISPGMVDPSARVQGQCIRALAYVSKDYLRTIPSVRDILDPFLFKSATTFSNDGLLAVCRCVGQWSAGGVSMSHYNPILMITAIVTGWGQNRDPGVCWALSNLCVLVDKMPAVGPEGFPTPAEINQIVEIAKVSFEMCREDPERYQETANAVRLIGSVCLLFSSSEEYVTVVQTTTVSVLSAAIVHHGPYIRKSSCQACKYLLEKGRCTVELLQMLTFLLEKDEDYSVRGEAADAVAAIPDVAGLAGKAPSILLAIMNTVCHLDDTQYFQQFQDSAQLGISLSKAFLNVVNKMYPWYPHPEVLEVLRTEFSLLASVLDVLGTYSGKLDLPPHILKDLHQILAGKY